MSTPKVVEKQVPAAAQSPIRFAWLELTPNCQLTCEHCYVASRPGLGHGKLRVSDWKRAIDELRLLGVQNVQFIGGEPTTHPHFCDLVEYAAERGFSIEVFSNLVGITPRMWDLFERHNVRIATSFYSIAARIHESITHLPGSYEKTVGNIKRALALGLTLRVGIIDIRDDQDVQGARAFLERLGVDPNQLGIDRVRGVGRGYELSKEDAESALCGKCTSGRCVVTAEGTVYPCIMARAFPVGSVLEQSIEDILTGDTFRSTVAHLDTAFAARDRDSLSCTPTCNPYCTPGCNPGCNPNCSPGRCIPYTCEPYCRP